ncbi:MAG: hypothetical protein M5R40_16085 [Anaerolineae bacterium]|nr:hypothetical protein [Anaerolineae bacterium]
MKEDAWADGMMARLAMLCPDWLMPYDLGDGDPGNCPDANLVAPNLVALCQRCHLHVQALWRPGDPPTLAGRPRVAPLATGDAAGLWHISDVDGGGCCARSGWEVDLMQMDTPAMAGDSQSLLPAQTLMQGIPAALAQRPDRDYHS